MGANTFANPTQTCSHLLRTKPQVSPRELSQPIFEIPVLFSFLSICTSLEACPHLAVARHGISSLLLLRCARSLAAVVWIYVETMMQLSSAFLRPTKRNILSILLIGRSSLTLFIRALPLVLRPSLRDRFGLRRFSDFVHRESDACVASVVFVCLQAIALLPITYLHSQLIVNRAFAASLMIIQTRQRLMDRVLSSGWLRAAASWFMRFCRLPGRTWWRERARYLRRMRIVTRWSRRVKRTDDFQKVFLPSVRMPTRLNRHGPYEVALNWGETEKVHPNSVSSAHFSPPRLSPLPLLYSSTLSSPLSSLLYFKSLSHVPSRFSPLRL